MKFYSKVSGQLKWVYIENFKYIFIYYYTKLWSPILISCVVAVVVALTIYYKNVQDALINNNIQIVTLQFLKGIDKIYNILVLF